MTDGPDRIATRDQNLAASEDIAHCTAKFYTTLREDGVDETWAGELASDYLDFMVSATARRAEDD